MIKHKPNIVRRHHHINGQQRACATSGLDKSSLRNKSRKVKNNIKKNKSVGCKISATNSKYCFVGAEIEEMFCSVNPGLKIATLGKGKKERLNRKGRRKRQFGSLPKNLSSSSLKPTMTFDHLKTPKSSQNIDKYFQSPSTTFSNPKTLSKSFKKSKKRLNLLSIPHSKLPKISQTPRNSSLESITRQTEVENLKITELLKPSFHIPPQRVGTFDVLDQRIENTKTQILNMKQQISRICETPKNPQEEVQRYKYEVKEVKPKETVEEPESEIEINSDNEFDINLKSQLKLGVVQKIINYRCNEIIDNNITKERFLERIEVLRTKRDLQTRFTTNQNIDSIRNADDIHKQIIKSKPKYMTDYEYRKMLINSRKNIEVSSSYKRAKFLVGKQEYLQDFREKKKKERIHFKIKSKAIQTWAKLILLVKLFRDTKFYIQRRNQEKHEAIAKFNSISIIEKVLGKFLKKYKDSRTRRCTNKIRFFSAFQCAILKDHTDIKSRDIILDFLEDRKSKCMMIGCFKSVKQKIIIIKATLKSKGVEKEAREKLFIDYWNNGIPQCDEALGDEVNGKANDRTFEK
ncbi:unnamed protein product [Moneuplotes crassus]|uniref:Uncharacterized protein n=1 Tax=Euplotes crassus TaxID=5936 RepID=A0AAD1Y0A7_EUPCR|nr:unnamed protein product [Moneuplotes crassus]